MSSTPLIKFCGLAALSMALLAGFPIAAGAQEGDLVTVHPASVTLRYAEQGMDGDCRGNREYCVEHGKIRTRDLMRQMCESDELPRSFSLAALVACEEGMDMVLVVWDRDQEEPVDCMPLPFMALAGAFAESGQGTPTGFWMNWVSAIFDEGPEMLLSVSGHGSIRRVPDRWEVDADFCMGSFESTAVTGGIYQGEEDSLVIKRGKITLGKPVGVTDIDLGEFFDMFEP
jgi:hypothetical protein